MGLLTRIKQIYKNTTDIVRSQRGRHAIVFLVFFAISAILWCVLSLNEELQYDLRMPLRLEHVPDSVTVISTPPTFISVSAKGKGTQLFKHSFGQAPWFNIDYRMYRNRNVISLGDADLKAIARSALGGAAIQLVSPDSVNLLITTKKPLRKPVSLDFQASPGPQSTIVGTPHLSPDSVRLYYVSQMPYNVKSISTEPIRLTDLSSTTTIRAKLIAPRNCRVIPDSVDVTVDVEPLIMKTRRVVIEPVNVPENMKLITFPAQIDVIYMVPMSIYRTTDPHFRVTADYHSVNVGKSRKVKLRLRDVPSELINVHLSADSAEYIIEKL